MRGRSATLSRDTTADAEARQLAIWREMSPSDRARVIDGASRAARTLAMAGLRARHPDAPAGHLLRLYADLTLGPDLARRIGLEPGSTDPSGRERQRETQGDGSMNDLLSLALIVAEALDRTGVRYSVGGSLASSFSGEPRATIDVDIVVNMAETQVKPFLQALGDGFYADEDALLRAVRSGSTANLIHHETGTKVDLFVSRAGLEPRQLARRRRVQVTAAPDRSLYIHSPEDILLQKLSWFRKGGETSERQWRDILSILGVQRDRLDRAYLREVAAEFGLVDLLARAAGEAGVTV